MTGVFAFMWLVSSAAWAKGLSDVKKATDPDVVITMINACKEGFRCREVYDPVVSGLNTSVVRPKRTVQKCMHMHVHALLRLPDLFSVPLLFTVKVILSSSLPGFWVH